MEDLDHDPTAEGPNSTPSWLHQPVLFLTPLQEERAALLMHLSGHEYVIDQRGGFWRGRLSDGTPAVVLCPPRMGQVAAALAARAAVERFRPSLTVLVGIAGGIKEAQVEVGDIVIADQIVYYEPGKVRDSGIEHRWQVYRVSERALEVARDIGDQVLREARTRGQRNPRLHVGTVCSGESVIASVARLTELRRDWSRAIGVEMEGAGVGAAMASLPPTRSAHWVMIRGVSDLADAAKDGGDPDLRERAADLAGLAAVATAAAWVRGAVPVDLPGPDADELIAIDLSRESDRWRAYVRAPGSRAGLSLAAVGDATLELNAAVRVVFHRRERDLDVRIESSDSTELAGVRIQLRIDGRPSTETCLRPRADERFGDGQIADLVARNFF